MMKRERLRWISRIMTSYTAASDLILFAYEKTAWDLAEAGEPPVADNPDEQLSRFPTAAYER